ncbi:MAG TPA: methyltransferase, partial [Opitutaceae bacterium]|nr:methyltransferase [Opitutaceae bacterium]
IQGNIATATWAEDSRCDVLIALHACNTATDDALARGIAADAQLLVVSPCCQKELRPLMRPPAILSDALRHGIFLERQAEFVTDALRAQMLEWAGYRTKVFEFVSTEHTARNVNRADWNACVALLNFMASPPRPWRATSAWTWQAE